MRRILQCTSEDFANYNAAQLKQAIQAGEGRTICAEMVVGVPGIDGALTQAEVARAFGADLMLFNGFDCFAPRVHGVQVEPDRMVKEVKRLVGRPIGVNLEPVDSNAQMLESRINISQGRTCSIETLERAEALGFDFICLTGNPGTGVTNQEIVRHIALAKEHFSGLVIAGKMHGAGAKEPVSNPAIVQELVAAGADIILVPAVGTVPGFTDAQLIEIVQTAHQHDALVLSAIGTSQETASQAVIEQIAIRNKVAGVDIQHIGDAGYGGMALVENIYAMSVAIRGKRHTINRMAISVNR